MPREYVRTPPAIRFWKKVAKTDECWIWTGHINEQGYGVFAIDAGVTRYAHGFAYADLHGAAPDTLDHTCHTYDALCAGGAACPHRRCVNPDHLEPVTRGENASRGAKRRTACVNGHPYDAANTRLASYGRKCRQCARTAALKAYYKRKAQR